tara:strand:- start:4838 stop:5047 length:210 start_codon:yes stop_codon:yes gene_type:complete
MWFWLTNKIHEWILIIMVVLVLGLIFFPEGTKGITGYAASNAGEAVNLVLYVTEGVFDIIGGIFEAMFS